MQQDEYQTNTVSKELIGYSNALNLIMAMFRLVAQDLKYGNKEVKQEARKFLKSAWFRELCDGIDLDSKHVRDTIIKSDRVSTRGSYE